MINLGQVAAIIVSEVQPGTTRVIWAKLDGPGGNLIDYFVYSSGSWQSFTSLYSPIEEGAAEPTDTKKIWREVEGGGTFLGYKAFDGTDWVDIFKDAENAAVAQALSDIRGGVAAAYDTLDKLLSALQVTNSNETNGRVLALADDNNFINFTNSGSITYQIPLDATTNARIGFITGIERNGSGSITVSAVAGVTLNGVDGAAYEIAASGGCYLRKVAANQWVIKGTLE